MKIRNREPFGIHVEKICLKAPLSDTGDKSDNIGRFDQKTFGVIRRVGRVDDQEVGQGGLVG